MKKSILASLIALAAFAALAPAANAGWGGYGYGRYYNGGYRGCDDCGYRTTYHSNWDDCDW